MSKFQRSPSVISVFFDGKCNLCSKEIDYYQRIAPKNTFNWVDITKTPGELDKFEIKLSDGLRLMHVADSNGNIFTGVDAFIIMWKQIKYWKFLGLFVSLPIVKQFAKLLYQYFADWRFNRYEHCLIAQENEKRS
jgi:predicted DCC family thiol-disulfide oxidoreductase YuxK